MGRLAFPTRTPSPPPLLLPSPPYAGASAARTPQAAGLRCWSRRPCPARLDHPARSRSSPHSARLAASCLSAGAVRTSPIRGRSRRTCGGRPATVPTAGEQQGAGRLVHAADEGHATGQGRRLEEERRGCALMLSVGMQGREVRRQSEPLPREMRNRAHGVGVLHSTSSVRRRTFVR